MTLFDFGESRPWSGRTTQGAVGDAGPYSSDNWQELYQFGFPGNSDFQAGVVPNSNEANNSTGTTRQPLKVVATSPISNAVTVQPGGAFVQGIWYHLDTSFNIPITANASGNSRIDCIVLRADFNGQVVRPYYLTGTPAGSPVPPTITQSATFWDNPIAYITVASGFTTIAQTVINDARQFTVPDKIVSYITTPGALGAGVTLEDAQLTIVSGAFTPAFSNLQGDQRISGVTEKLSTDLNTTGSQDSFRIVTHGLTYVEVNGAGSASQFLEQSSTTGQARFTARPESPIGIALESAGGAGEKILAFISPSLPHIYPYVQIADVKTANTAGGTFTSGAWQTRVLNTESFDTNGLASLAANQITLQPGVWYTRIQAPAYRVDGHRLRLRNITAGTTIQIGQAGYTPNATDSTQSTAYIMAEFTLAAVTVLEVQHRCTTTQATNGFGLPVNIDSLQEVYTVAEFWRILAAP